MYKRYSVCSTLLASGSGKIDIFNEMTHRVPNVTTIAADLHASAAPAIAGKSDASSRSLHVHMYCTPTFISLGISIH